MRTMIGGLLLAAVFSAQGQSYSGRGGGTSSCGEYLEMIRKNEQNSLIQMNQWVWGVLTGYNFYGRPGIVIPDGPSIRAYLEKHCKEKPLDTIVAGTLVMIRQLGGAEVK